MPIDRTPAERFAQALGHVLGPWTQRRAFMDDLFVPDDDPGASALPRVWTVTCARCGAQLADDREMAADSELLADWCPWLLIVIPERRAEAARAYRAWWCSLGREPLPWAGGDEPPPIPPPPGQSSVDSWF